MKQGVYIVGGRGLSRSGQRILGYVQRLTNDTRFDQEFNPQLRNVERCTLAILNTGRGDPSLLPKANRMIPRARNGPFQKTAAVTKGLAPKRSSMLSFRLRDAKRLLDGCAMYSGVLSLPLLHCSPQNKPSQGHRALFLRQPMPWMHKLLRPQARLRLLAGP